MKDDILYKLNDILQEDDVCEAIFKKVIRGGKAVRKLICPANMKAVGGKCVRMSAAEVLKRSKAAKKAQKKIQADPSKKAKLEKKKAKSLKKRIARIPKAASEPGQQIGVK